MTTSSHYSDTALTLLKLAKAEALALKRAEIEPDHLWLALLRDKDGRGVQIIHNLGLDEATLYERLHAHMSQGKQPPLENEIQLSTRTGVVISRATRLIGSPLGTIISPEFFFLALMYETQSQGYQLLHNVGITRERVQANLGLATFDLTSLRLEAAKVPPALDKRRIQRLDNARLYHIPFLWLILVSVLFVLLGIYIIFHINDIHHALQLIFSAAPFLLAEPRPEWFPWLALVIGLIGNGLWYLLSLPLYGIYAVWLPHLYKQTTPVSPHLVWRWFINHSRLRVINGCLFLVSLEVVYMFFCLLPSFWWAASALYIGLFSLAQMYLKPMLMIPLSFKLTPVPEGPLTARLAALCQRSGTHVDGLYVMESKAPKTMKAVLAANVLLMRWGSQVRIMLTDTVYQKFPLDEQEVILAHELGHLVHHDLLRRIAWKTLFYGLFLCACHFYFFAPYPPATHLSSFMHKFSVTPLFMAALFYFSLGLLFLYFWLYRRHEKRADEYALHMTQNSDAFKSAMNRLARYGLLPASAKRQTRASTHPTLQQRLAHADAFARRQASRVTPPPQ